ncbi:MAG: nitroreductase family protein [Clostridiales bacterium]|nr:nitroreductase family protein [Clostridiales bacterium]MCF8022962.1 nitroreductase family protein [Clostridiales bacterium]
MEILEAINSRKSVRKFKPDSIIDENIQKLLDAAIKAPTAGNAQPWYFYVIKDKSIKDALSAASLGQKFVNDAPVVIAVCVDPEVSAAKYGDRGRYLYCIQDSAAAVENIMLAAVSMDLGTCWVGAFEEEKVKQVLNMPAGRRPAALIPLGYPEKIDEGFKRKPLNEVVEYKN